MSNNTTSQSKIDIQLEAIVHELQAIRKMLSEELIQNESSNTPGIEREHIDKVVAAIKVIKVNDGVYIIDERGNMIGYNTINAHAHIRAVCMALNGSSSNGDTLAEIAKELSLKAIYEEQCNKDKPDRPEVTSPYDGIRMAMVVISSILGVLAIVWSNTGGI